MRQDEDGTIWFTADEANRMLAEAREDERKAISEELRGGTADIDEIKRRVDRMHAWAKGYDERLDEIRDSAKPKGGAA